MGARVLLVNGGKEETMNVWVPVVGEKMAEVVVEQEMVWYVTNLPEPGTPIRATLGETVIVGVVSKQPSTYAVVHVDIKPLTKKSYAGLLSSHSLWTEDGWTFELLGSGK